MRGLESNKSVTRLFLKDNRIEKSNLVMKNKRPVPLQRGEITMKLQPQLRSRTATLPRAVTRCLSPVTVRCCFALLLCLVIPRAGRAQTLTTLANFSGTNGANPYFAPLVQGRDGNLYGTTSAGGAHGQGTVFKVTPTGTLTTLYSFCAQSRCADGSAPFAGLLLGTDGNFYGTTESGGANGEGSVFKITPRGRLTTLHSFNISDGSNPYAALIQATDGNFYGTTEAGGAHILGTVFKITPQGVLTTLHSFNDTPDGSSPEAALLQAADGNFYSTTYNGGSSGGYGTVFKITPAGALTTLHLFDDTEGQGIIAGLVEASDGNFYGTAGGGGANGYGSVFTITPEGVLTLLHSFNVTDGATPTALVLATDGNFYGGTISGGANIDGTIFEITPQGAFTKLYDFNRSDGADPFAGLVQATSGAFYGTTMFGGSRNDGTVFLLNVGLGPFVITVPHAGKVGARVRILGTNLTGATNVSFNGAAAAFTVLSPSEIATTVPAGATTGTVQVTTPSGLLLSNVVFQVTQ
jgi:uncharacterized repeat protein (TIGR03803 family)